MYYKLAANGDDNVIDTLYAANPETFQDNDDRDYQILHLSDLHID
jgi:hypothetical protein